MPESRPTVDQYLPMEGISLGYRAKNVQEFITALRSTLPPDALSTDSQKNRPFATDEWPRLQIWDRMAERTLNMPDAVAFPRSESEIISVLKLCQAHRIPAIPYGQGHGVCGGTVPTQGGIIIDTKHLQAIGEVDDIDLTIDVEAGVTGNQLEATLNKQGYTLGHFPLATRNSTVGGWLATRSAGQYSSRYGTVADLVESLTVVLSNGETLSTNEPHLLEWNQLILGSEGTLGVITKARLRVTPLADAETYRGYRFRTLEAGLLGLRLLMQSGLKPHLVHFYDPFESLLQSSGEGTSRGGLASGVLTPLKEILATDAGSDRTRAGKKFGLAIALSRPAILNSAVDKLPVPCLLVFGFQGTQQSVDQDMTAARQLLEQAGGTDGGEGPGHRWKSTSWCSIATPWGICRWCLHRYDGRKLYLVSSARGLYCCTSSCRPSRSGADTFHPCMR